MRTKVAVAPGGAVTGGIFWEGLGSSGLDASQGFRVYGWLGRLLMPTVLVVFVAFEKAFAGLLA